MGTVDEMILEIIKSIELGTLTETYNVLLIDMNMETLCTIYYIKYLITWWTCTFNMSILP